MVEGWVDLGNAVQVHNLCPTLYIAEDVVINTTAGSVIQTWVLTPLTLQSDALTTRLLKPAIPSHALKQEKHFV